MKHSFKSTILWSMVLGGLMTFSSCKKYLEVESPSTLSQEVTFNTVSNTGSVINGVYAMLIGDNGYGSRIATLFPQTADDFKTSGNYSALDRRGISMYGASPANSDIEKPFNQLFAGIDRANVCIKYIPQSVIFTSGSESDKATMRKYLGEALTLRAQFYYEAIRNWGDLPAQFEPSADMKDLYLPQTNRDTLYDHLLNDLKEAEDMVPWRSQSGYTSTHVTKGVVKGLRARIALARGGYSLRNETHQMERRADYKKYYQIAYDECKEIIASGEHGLNPVYENIFKTLHSATRLDPTNELMFEVGAFGGNASTDSKLGYYNGLKIESTNTKFGPGGGGINAIPTYFYEFDSIGDLRRDVTINVYEIDKNSKKFATNADVFTDGKFRRSWTNIGSPAAQNLAINWPLMRYADILLMYAEADNELNNGPSAGAITAFEQVRRRAFTGHEDRMGITPTDKQGFFNAIVQERLLEFGGEGIRKYDLIRWNLLATKIEETRSKLWQFMRGEGRYANLPLYVYTKPADYNVVASNREVETLDVYDGPASKAFFTPGAGVKTAPASDYVVKNWRKAVDSTYILSDTKGFARYFEPNKKELLPFHTSAVGSNFNLKQNYGY